MLYIGSLESRASLDDPDLGDAVAEIKRMYAAPSARGTGAAAVLLRALEDEARSLSD